MDEIRKEVGMKSLIAVAALVASMFAYGQNPRPLGTIVVTVADASGARIPGVTVRALGPGGVTTGVTNISGEVSLRVSEGAYSVTATLRGFLSREVYIAVKSAEDVALPITMQPISFAPNLNPFERAGDVDIRGDSFTTQGNTALYRGNVRMRTDGAEIRADEIDFNTVTRTASARGNVTIQVLTTGPRVIPLSNE